MMRFKSKEKQQELLSLLESWVGTPYRHRAHVKGMGCDCIGLPIGVLTELKILNITDKDVPHYPRDYHMHSTRSLLIEYIKKYLNVEEIKDNSFKNGDLLCFKFGMTAAHAGFWFNDYLYESVDGSGVLKTHYPNSQWRHKLQHVFRIMEG